MLSTRSKKLVHHHHWLFAVYAANGSSKNKTDTTVAISRFPWRERIATSSQTSSQTTAMQTVGKGLKILPRMVGLVTGSGGQKKDGSLLVLTRTAKSDQVQIRCEGHQKDRRSIVRSPWSRSGIDTCSFPKKLQLQLLKSTRRSRSEMRRLPTSLSPEKTIQRSTESSDSGRTKRT